MKYINRKCCQLINDNYFHWLFLKPQICFQLQCLLCVWWFSLFGPCWNSRICTWLNSAPIILGMRARTDSWPEYSIIPIGGGTIAHLFSWFMLSSQCQWLASLRYIAPEKTLHYILWEDFSEKFSRGIMDGNANKTKLGKVHPEYDFDLMLWWEILKT